jgi:hypothetical protein
MEKNSDSRFIKVDDLHKDGMVMVMAIDNILDGLSVNEVGMGNILSIEMKG